MINPAENSDEFVAAISGDSVFSANYGAEPGGDVSQQSVASSMAEKIADCYEPIQVKEQHCGARLLVVFQSQSRDNHSGLNVEGASVGHNDILSKK